MGHKIYGSITRAGAPRTRTPSRYIARDNGRGANDGPSSNLDARHDLCGAAYPTASSDDGRSCQPIFVSPHQRTRKYDDVWSDEAIFLDDDVRGEPAIALQPGGVSDEGTSPDRASVTNARSGANARAFAHKSVVADEGVFASNHSVADNGVATNDRSWSKHGRFKI